ncbi:hypothetical protein SAMN05192558_101815 [Actinokineospora alba]|uniref:PknH-like extracellular domain-containing protein n=1 Tax=Actinokineospora alba TaxID=504798 RepID=A0A1H0GIW4_9PSEU|nr:hypothetical protein [Actinokineospora alba]TDP69913.1 hypothetical protein C8E96_5509 [Actinokineospora alba]SDI06050.1 hypothetical protein SAMN05421871_10356 [Actinokineospora alba]SDO06770.1 hypothetical protein SAMN05192558_101815 [Actinokineospora alba]
MRRVQALAGAAVLPVLLATACSDRPNDLYTYYDDPSSEAATTAAPSPVTTSTTTTTTTTTRRASDPAAAALTAIDLAAEEVQPDGAPKTLVETALPDCAAPLPSATDAIATTWRYASGSVLRQYVAVHAAGSSVIDDLKDALDCGTFTVDGLRYEIDDAAKTAVPPGVDAGHTWCATNPRRPTCTLALAKADVLSVVTVEASTLARAQAAIARLAPVAAGKLTSLSD